MGLKNGMKNGLKTSSEKLAILKLALSMTIFGTIGLFSRFIPLPSSVIAIARGFIGTIVLLFVLLLKKQKMDAKSIKNNLLLLITSGVAIGINWIFLFESYRYTTVAKATLCYYLAPVFVTIAATFFLKEKLTGRKLACILVALLGMAFVSGVIGEGISSKEVKGIVFGVLAAILYATVIILNKKLGKIGAYDRTIVQLFMAAASALPYVILVEGESLKASLGIAGGANADFISDTSLTVNATAVVMLVVVGVVHTGIAYALYFSSMTELKAQTIAIFSYIDPIVAIMLSALFLNEKMGVYGIIGAVLILGSTYISERGSE